MPILMHGMGGSHTTAPNDAAEPFRCLVAPKQISAVDQEWTTDMISIPLCKAVHDLSREKSLYGLE